MFRRIGSIWVRAATEESHIEYLSPPLPPAALLEELRCMASGLGLVHPIRPPIVVLGGNARWVSEHIVSEGLGVSPASGLPPCFPRAGPDDELLDELMDLTGQSGALLLPVVGILAPLTKLSRRMLARWKQSPPSTASDMLWESITELARDRPRVLVFGDVTDTGPDGVVADHSLRPDHPPATPVGGV